MHLKEVILAIDIGNTHIEIGVFNNDTFIDSWRIATGVHRTEDEAMAYIDHFLSLKSMTPDDVSGLVIASVVPNVTQIFCRLSAKYFSKKPLIINCGLALGLRIDYQPPSSVGADRLCNAVAAFEKYGGPCIIVDVGTATTFDVISAEGVYLGGIIAPGLETAGYSLYQRASKLPTISYEFPDTVIGKTTEQSMQSGIMWGTISFIDGLIDRVTKELMIKPVVIATGGQSNILAPNSRFIKHVEPHLVLEGMIKIYRRNQLVTQ